jgi:deferrochelatase/peroxidase EfeB
MRRGPLTFADADFADIQGLVRFGHSHLKQARFYLLRISDPAAARSWLAARTPPEMPLRPLEHALADPSWAKTEAKPLRVTTAVKGSSLPAAALQVAFTHAGLKALGVPKKILRHFSAEFKTGMAEESRSRRLGDVDANDPEGWAWGMRENEPHLLVLLYARDGIDAWEAKVKGDDWNAAFSDEHCLSTSNMDGVEPFGFVDGISQPVIDWERQKPTRLRETRTYTNLASLGEFLLGYPNEYCRYTDRPLLDPGDDPKGLLPLAEDMPGKRDFGRNGTYLVLRDLAQNVPGFWQFIDHHARQDARKREHLARAMLGRMRSGEPIVPLSDHPIAGVADQADEKERMKDLWGNQFTFDKDPDGTACPFGAHIRRANPRNADLPAGARGPVSRLLRRLGFDSTGPHADLLASTRFHRILRRGREYGEEIKPDAAMKANEPDWERGLRFICLNANISRQFEFVQTAWIASAKFSGTDEGDPLLGNRKPLRTGQPTDGFTRPQDDGIACRTARLPQFVKVRGGAYFFLPGISALRYLAHGPHSAGQLTASTAS